MHVNSLAVEWVVATLECLTQQNSVRDLINHFNTHHVVCDQLEVPEIDVDVVDAKYAAHLLHNSSTGHLYAVCHEDSVDVVRVNIILLDQRLFSPTRYLPKTAEVGAVSGYL